MLVLCTLMEGLIFFMLDMLKYVVCCFLIYMTFYDSPLNMAHVYLHMAHVHLHMAVAALIVYSFDDSINETRVLYSRF